MTRLYLVRHPAVALVEGVCYGVSDVALRPGWPSTVERALERIEPVDRERAVVYSSPLARCIEPARTVGRTVRVDDRLRELDFGAWEMRTWEAIGRAAIDAWASDPAHHAPPGGESLATLMRRSLDFVDEVRDQRHESVIAFTHAGFTRCLVAALLGGGPEQAFRVTVDFGSVTLAVLDGEHSRIGYVNR